jgi:hypothetical protein
MQDTSWYRLLEKIFKDDRYWEMEGDDLSQLSESLDMDEDEVDEAIDNLQKQELIKKDMDEIVLTKRGFNLISRMETHEEQILTERLLLVVVTALSLGTLIESSASMASSSVSMRMVYSAVFGVVFLAIGMMANQHLTE